MILLLLKTYLLTLAYIGLFSLIFFIGGCYLIMEALRKKHRPKLHLINLAAKDYESDIAAIAGDDVLPTQLDLARAFLEIGRIDEVEGIIAALLQDSKNKHNPELLALIHQVNTLKQARATHAVSS